MIRQAMAELAAHLAGVRVLALLADNRPAWAIADLCALDGGIAQLPLPVFFTPAQVGHALKATGADALLTDQPAQAAALDPRFVLRA